MWDPFADPADVEPCVGASGGAAQLGPGRRGLLNLTLAAVSSR